MLIKKRKLHVSSLPSFLDNDVNDIKSIIYHSFILQLPHIFVNDAL